MANRSLSITLTLLVVAFAAATATGLGGGGGLVGGRTKVKHVETNQEIQDLGRYSVEQYNNQQQGQHQKNGGGDLKFRSVVEAETQVVSGTKYYLKISAVDRNGVPKTFDAVVVVKPWVHSKELLGFSPSPATK